MRGRMREVSASTKQDRLPQLFLINKFPGPLNSSGEERNISMQMERRDIMDSDRVRPGPQGARWGEISGRKRTGGQAALGVVVADNHH